jgi:hypothetical protein
MPIPKRITVFNKYVTNRFFLLFAGWIPPFAIVNHKGRKSGRSYRTPILAFRTETGFIFALTYGRNVDWVKNLIASDIGSLEFKGNRIPIYGMRLGMYDDLKDKFPFWIRFSLRIISLKDCLLVEANI